MRPMAAFHFYGRTPLPLRAPESWRRYKRAAAILAVALWCLTAPVSGWTMPPEHFVTKGLTMETRTGTIVVRVGISVDNEAGLHDMLKDGASVQLTAELQLERLRSLWTNVTLAEQTYTSMLRHNPLTREFLLYMPGETTPVADRNLSRLLAATWHKLSFPLGPVDLLRQAEAGSQYRISVYLTLRHTEVPPWLAKAFVFWSKEVVEPVTLAIPFSF